MEPFAFDDDTPVPMPDVIAATVVPPPPCMRNRMLPMPQPTVAPLPKHDVTLTAANGRIPATADPIPLPLHEVPRPERDTRRFHRERLPQKQHRESDEHPQAPKRRRTEVDSACDPLPLHYDKIFPWVADVVLARTMFAHSRKALLRRNAVHRAIMRSTRDAGKARRARAAAINNVWWAQRTELARIALEEADELLALVTFNLRQQHAIACSQMLAIYAEAKLLSWHTSLADGLEIARRGEYRQLLCLERHAELALLRRLHPQGRKRGADDSIRAVARERRRETGITAAPSTLAAPAAVSVEAAPTAAPVTPASAIPAPAPAQALASAASAETGKPKAKQPRSESAEHPPKIRRREKPKEPTYRPALPVVLKRLDDKEITGAMRDVQVGRWVAVTWHVKGLSATTTWRGCVMGGGRYARVRYCHALTSAGEWKDLVDDDGDAAFEDDTLPHSGEVEERCGVVHIEVIRDPPDGSNAIDQVREVEPPAASEETNKKKKKSA
jgi:hypothetical protein